MKWAIGGALVAALMSTSALAQVTANALLP